VAIEFALEAYRDDALRFVERQSAGGGSAGPSTTRFYGCGAGVASFHVGPNGDMHPCLMGQSIAYNVPAMGFGPAWKAVTSAVDGATWEGVGGCADCSNSLLCGYCPGLFELEDTTPARPPEYVCRLGESRYRIIDAYRQGVVGVRAI
jgi:radical SAM protein with 4Fe4S-binding SPASM domain